MAARPPSRAVLLAALVICACNAGGNVTGDGQADTGDVADGSDPREDRDLEDGAEVPDAGHDTGHDLPPDPAHDVPHDPGHDTSHDPGADPGHDAADVSADGDCLPLEVDVSAPSAWVLCFMGTGTHVTFTLEYENPSTGCALTSVSVTGGALRLSSDGSAIATFGTISPSTTFSGTVAAGTRTSVDYHASDPADTSAHDGATVYVTLDVSYDTPTSTRDLSLESSTTSHTCVY